MQEAKRRTDDADTLDNALHSPDKKIRELIRKLKQQSETEWGLGKSLCLWMV